MSLKFMDVFDGMQNDIFVVARTPPIKGFIRTTKNNGTDPLDGSNIELWRNRLETIFISVMTEREFYTQMRYIGFADNGKELVRVNRTENGLARVSVSELQQKGDEPYMKAAEQLPNGLAYFTKVNYNREQGKIDSLLLPTIRVLVSIYGDNGKPFGVIVLNVDYSNLIKNTLEFLTPADNVLVINQSGDYLEHKKNGTIGEFQFHQNYTVTPPLFVSKVIHNQTNETSLIEDDNISYFVKLNLSSNDSENYVGIALRKPKEELLANAFKTRDEILLISIFLIIGSVAISFTLARKFTQPLRQMTIQLSNITDYNSSVDLPTHLTDEIGELAKSFQGAIKSLLESEAKSKAVLDSVNDGIITINSQGLIVAYNPQCCQIFGYATNEVLDKNIALLIPKEPIEGGEGGFIENYLQTRKKGTINTNREVQGLHKDGSVFPMELSISEVKVNSGILFTAIVRDISDRKAAEKEMERLIEALKQSNKELDDFAYVASHDLKAPLRVIDNTSRWLEEDLDEIMDDDSKENLELMRNRVKRMEKLLDDLLEYSRIGRKIDDRYAEEVNGAVLANDIKLLLSQPDDFNIVFNPMFAKTKFKRMPLQQVLHNLINNAIKHHHSSKGNVDIWFEEFDGKYKFHVKDDGPGIPAQYQDQIFEMFLTLKPRDQVEGSGMGLAMVKKNVEHLGGTITLKSVEGQGTDFIFIWPKTLESSVN
ncbi:ATP-binding protein [Reichenbachiella faecimaris]|nr:ATP-binding protein [Reichenbachiella faecimaris]